MTKTKDLKVLQGTLRPSREIDETVEYEEWDGQRMPICPKGWPLEMQSFWNDRCHDLKNVGYLAKACIEPLRRYCWAVYQAREAERRLDEEGFLIEQTGTKGQIYTVKNPWLDILDQSVRVIERYGAKFGFTPLDVQKIPNNRKEVGKMSLLK